MSTNSNCLEQEIPISRRGFLATLAVASAAAQISGADKPPVIDTHMHVWGDDPVQYPFAHPFQPRSSRRR